MVAAGTAEGKVTGTGDLAAVLAGAGMLAGVEQVVVGGVDMAVVVPAVPESAAAVLQLDLAEADIVGFGPTPHRQQDIVDVVGYEGRTVVEDVELCPGVAALAAAALDPRARLHARVVGGLTSHGASIFAVCSSDEKQNRVRVGT